MLGFAPVGLDLAVLLNVGAHWGWADVADLETDACSAYLRGLRSAGFTGSEDDVIATWRIYTAMTFGILTGRIVKRAFQRPDDRLDEKLRINARILRAVEQYL